MSAESTDVPDGAPAPPHLAYRGAQLDVREQDLSIRGRVRQFEWVSRPLIVLAVPVTPAGRFVLASQYRAAVGWTLEFPAGKVDHYLAETPERAVARELREEVGFRLTHLEPLGTLLTAPHFADERIQVFSARGEIAFVPRPTTREQISGEEVSEEGLDGLIGSGRLVDAKSLAALMLHRRAGRSR